MKKRVGKGEDEREEDFRAFPSSKFATIPLSKIKKFKSQ